MRRYNTVCGLAVALCLMLGTGRVQAQIQLTIPDTTTGTGEFPTGTSAPYAKVALTQGTNEVTIVVTAEPSGAGISALGFNATGVSNVLVSESWSSLTNKVMGGFGTFTTVYGVTTGIGYASETLEVFGTGLTTSSFTGNSGGYQFAVDWASNTSTTPPITGYAANLAVPEPGPLLGAGVVTLIGLGYTWRRRRRATA